jgi:hypothetical protein
LDQSGQSWILAGGGLSANAGYTSIRTTTMYIESNPKRLARILQDVTF